MKSGVRVAAAACFALGTSGVLLGAGIPYRFDSPEVMNLADAEQLAKLQKGSSIPTVKLAPEVAAAILAAPDRSTDSPGQVPYTGDDDSKARKHEQAVIATEGASVRRSTRLLEISPQSAAVVSFKDSKTPARTDADGDSESYLYAGRIGAGGYHRVEVLFGQDSPGSFFVNPANGKTAFAHNGSDAVALSPDGRWVMSLNPLNSPFPIAIVVLSAEGPGLELQCHSGDAGKIASAAFKGWQDPKTFDVVLSLGQEGNGKAAAIPIRLQFDGQAWQLSTPDPKLLEKAGYACWR